MSHEVAEGNKRLVLEAFYTLFNRRNYAAAEESLVSAVHPAQRTYPSGRERRFDLIEGKPPTLHNEPDWCSPTRSLCGPCARHERCACRALGPAQHQCMRHIALTLRGRMRGARGFSRDR
jgi:hypothetical protein